MLTERDGYKEVQLGPRKLEIPNSWPVDKLGVLTNRKKGKRPDQLFEDNLEEENLIPYLSADYMRGNEKAEYCKESDDNKIEADDKNIIMIWDGSYSGHVFTGFNGALSSTMVKINGSRGLTEKYLYYSLSENFPVFQSTTIGTSVPHVARSIFENLNVPVPPLPEQRKIAEVLSTVDKAIQKTEEIIERSKELKKGLMQDLLTKGIGHEEFKEVQLGPREIDIPSEWRVKNLKNLSTSKPSYGANASSVKYLPQLPRYIRITDISEEGYLKDDEKKSIALGDAKGHYLQPGDIVFARSGATVGKTYLQKDNGEYVYAGYLIKFGLDSSKIIPEFIFYVTHSHYYYSWVKSKIRATSQPNINAKEYSSFKILLPSISEQKKIVNILSTVDEKIQKEKDYKEKLEKLKKGLMQDLLTGKVRVLPLLSAEEKEELKEADVPG